MDFNVKKLVRDAGTALSRVVQVLKGYWEEYFIDPLLLILSYRLS